MIKTSLAYTAGIILIPLIFACSETVPNREKPPAINPVSFLSQVSEDVSGYTEAASGYKFEFPKDHGAHNAYRNEWWYVTGTLYDENENRYGFQLTIFRSSINQQLNELQTNWSVRNVYMGHFAITDGQKEQFHQHEIFSRDSLNLAGSSSTGLDVWIGNWFIKGEATAENPILVRGEAGGFSLDLKLISSKPIVLQGDEGFSMKSSDGGAASHYYSMTRLHAEGNLRIDGRDNAVEGTAWMDREWSSNSLGRDHAGWDWFALHLSDGSDLMYYRMRLTNGEEDTTSGGIFVSELGEVVKLKQQEFLLQVVDYWSSPQDGPRYPAGWILQVPSLDIDLTIAPLLPDQELQGVFRYWEGAVSCSESLSVNGSDCTGYVELTGY